MVKSFFSIILIIYTFILSNNYYFIFQHNSLILVRILFLFSQLQSILLLTQMISSHIFLNNSFTNNLYLYSLSIYLFKYQLLIYIPTYLFDVGKKFIFIFSNYNQLLLLYKMILFWIDYILIIYIYISHLFIYYLLIIILFSSICISDTGKNFIFFSLITYNQLLLIQNNFIPCATFINLLFIYLSINYYFILQFIYIFNIGK